MFKLHVIQAQFGDSLVLSFGKANKPRHILVDGGPPGNYAADLAPALDQIVGRGGTLDLVLLSHIDNDHVIGLLDLLAAIEEDTVSDREPLVRIAGLWHNSFERTIDPDGAISQQLQVLMQMAGAAQAAMPASATAFYGIKEGNRLRLMAHKLRIPANKGFKDDLLIVETAKATPIKFGPLGLRIAGPTKANLKTLQDKWLKWLEETAKQVSRGDPVAAAMADRSIPNLSSIVVLAECDGKTLLLTGDARGDHIVEGLQTAKLFKNDNLHVDVLKVQHHGSDRNTTRKFFDQVTADTYILSANGKYGNPDFITMKWIVESARDRKKPIKLVATNETDTIKELREKLKPSDYGYSLNVLPPGQHSVEIVLIP